MTCALYRHFDADGFLLYVGISSTPDARLQQHRSSPWFSEIRRVVIEMLPDRETAERAEREAIRTEWPLYNKPGAGARQPGRDAIQKIVIATEGEVPGPAGFGKPGTDHLEEGAA